MKEVDAKIISLRYKEQQPIGSLNSEINYKMFFSQIQEKIKAIGKIAILNQGPAPLGAGLLQPGLHAIDMNSEVGLRLKRILGVINDYVTKSRY